jgi:hypothetical protein
MSIGTRWSATLIRMKEVAGREKDRVDSRACCWSGLAMTDRVESDTETAWRAHNLEQLLYFRSFSLREKLEAVEGMAEVVRLLERMRENERPNDLAGRKPSRPSLLPPRG